MEKSKAINKICYIVGAGEFSADRFTIDFSAPESLLIAADGGYNHLCAISVKPDIIIGDLDSIKSDIPDDIELIELNPEKDDTDIMSAVKHAISKGYRCFHIYGGLGGRLAHTLANIEILAFLSKNKMESWLFSDDCVITAVSDGEINFDKSRRGTISVFSHDETAHEVYLKGLKYPVNGGDLKNTFPLGVSNEFIGLPSSVSIKCGTLIVVLE